MGEREQARDTGNAARWGTLFRLRRTLRLSLLKSPSEPELTLKRTRSSEQPMVGHAETSRSGSVVAAVGTVPTETTCTRGVRTMTIVHYEELGQAARV